jgi:hypothetical protein
MFNLENQIPKLCHLAQEMGEKEKICILHAAGLQALSSMVFVSLVMPCALLSAPVWFKSSLSCIVYSLMGVIYSMM